MSEEDLVASLAKGAIELLEMNVGGPARESLVMQLFERCYQRGLEAGTQTHALELNRLRAYVKALEDAQAAQTRQGEPNA